MRKTLMVALLLALAASPAFAEGGWTSSQMSARDGDRGENGRDGPRAPSPYYFEGASNHNPNTVSANTGNATGVGGKATSGGSVGKASIR